MACTLHNAPCTKPKKVSQVVEGCEIWVAWFWGPKIKKSVVFFIVIIIISHIKK